ncbi:hypothetical protein AVEN_177676-1 [Araneus ventricosus]|uniref:Uncharacterized protein n=1 Tax=Araneus ventricosus TaxID=182803 RepID=A0A4Y2WRQ9_ARAVE|nr:hypothetical protein AVEN_177676-1 [Araneus ventricosus]
MSLTFYKDLIIQSCSSHLYQQWLVFRYIPPSLAVVKLNHHICPCSVVNRNGGLTAKLSALSARGHVWNCGIQNYRPCSVISIMELCKTICPHVLTCGHKNYLARG